MWQWAWSREGAGQAVCGHLGPQEAGPAGCRGRGWMGSKKTPSTERMVWIALLARVAERGFSKCLTA